jgi:hypothetical protein
VGTGRDREWAAALPLSRILPLSRVGGRLRLGADEVVFEALARLARRRRIALGDVAAVEPAGTRPPRLRIDVRGDKPLTLIVLPRLAMPIWTGDAAARDDAVQAIRAAARQRAAA